MKLEKEMVKLEAKYIVVRGIVQGVGFRPFVYRIAKENNLKGDVSNTSGGVFINIEGTEKHIKGFIKSLTDKPPELSRIENIKIEDRPVRNYKTFKIISSEVIKGGITLISPDIATCSDCMREVMKMPEDERYKYEFTNCTNCGPRFTIIKALPYDRKNTTMNDFPMCESCSKEYLNPEDRRFHAEPTCCPLCGPKVVLLNQNGHKVESDDIMKSARKLIKRGKIICVKGIGGFNLICDGENEEAISKLRDRKNRKRKPLAVMMKDIDTVRRYAEVSEEEYRILTGNKKPILLLKKKSTSLPYNISFENDTLGILLPYSPLHFQLFDDDIHTIVFTSGNYSGGSIIYKNDEAVRKLSHVADYFLIHNRDINMPIDDSVSRINLGRELVIRSGRGYSPYYIKCQDKVCILSCGADLKSTFAVNIKNNLYVSPHIGDLASVEVQKSYIHGIEHVESIYGLKPDIVAYDMHPGYWQNGFIKEKYKDIKAIGVYHHHAHIASCMADNGFKDGSVIGLAFDGTGYGEDGRLWGSEFLICRYKSFKRTAHLDYMGLPGGDAGTMNPWYMGVSLLYKTYGDEAYSIVGRLFKGLPFNTVIGMVKGNFRTYETCSMGRLFDAVAALIGFRDTISYEGEAAVFLENMAQKVFFMYEDIEEYRFALRLLDDEYIIYTDGVIKSIINDIAKGEDGEIISLKFHKAVVNMSVYVAGLIKNKYGIITAALSGGVFQNKILFSKLYEGLKESGFRVLTHGRVPCNDGGISVGQFFIASEIAEEM